MKEIWVEKYRPTTLDDIVGQDDVVSRLKAYVKAGNLPHLLFAGPAGTGKTTSAIALARELFGENWRAAFSGPKVLEGRGGENGPLDKQENAPPPPLGGGGVQKTLLF